MILVLTGNAAEPLVMVACSNIDADGNALMHTCNGKVAESGVMPMGPKFRSVALAEMAMAQGVARHYAAMERKDGQ